MRVLVCGGRDFNDEALAFAALDAHHERQSITLVIQGGAAGADTLAKEWAISRGVPQVEYPAAWDVHRRAAGTIRNQQMLDEGKPDLVIAFPGGRGTADMTRKALAAGVLVLKLP